MLIGLSRTFCSLGVCVAAAAIAPPPAEWLKANAIPLRTLEPSDGGFADLAPLKAIIGDARIVMLGEQAHAEGATFLGKTRLIQFLHEEMDFDVLCFESGLYDCERSWQALKGGTDAWTAMSMGIFPIWMQAAELAPLTDFLDARAKSTRPLELCGYDCQLTGSATHDHLLAGIKALNSRGVPPPLDEGSVAALDAYFAALMAGRAPDAVARVDGDKALQALGEAFTAERFPGDSPRDLAFWKQMLRSLPAFTTMLSNSNRADPSLPEKFNPRDEQGGETMVWLARERYPNRKIIVWAASMHCVRSPEGITPLMPGLNYAGVKTMGHVASASLGKDVFIISFVSGAGTAGNVFGRQWPIPEPPAESLEALCKALTLGPCVIPLRGAQAESFGAAEFVARPLGNAPMRATWQRHVDAFVYTPTMTPATQRLTREDAAEFSDLKTVLDRKTARNREHCANGHAFADKGDLSDVWDTWKSVTRPTAQKLDEAQRTVAEWTLAHRDDPCVGWRALALSAHVAQGAGDAVKAIGLLDDALAAYPKTAHSDPMRQSSFHHLANARAILECNRAGPTAGITWITDQIKGEDRMRAFFAPPWQAHFAGNPGSLAYLREMVKEAFAERAKRLSDQTESIRAAAELADRSFEGE
jgi:erythromycin esterase